MHDNPNIIGGKRVANSAATVCACILLGAVVVLLCYWFLFDAVPADLLVGAGFS